MHIGIAFRILGSLLMVFSLTMLPPLLVSLFFVDGVAEIFVDAFGYTLISGFVLWLAFRRFHDEMRIRDGFLVTVLFYLALGIFGTVQRKITTKSTTWKIWRTITEFYVIRTRPHL